MSDDRQHPLAPMVRKLELWCALSAGDRAAILSLPYHLASLQPDQPIVAEGDRATHSCLLRSGFAYRQKIVRTGHRQILSIHMPGDLVDLQNSLLLVADHGVHSLTSAEVAYIPREAMLELAFAYPTVGKAMWFDTLVDAAIFREAIANIGRRDAIMRLAHLLCEFGVRLEAADQGTHVDYELPMTQEELGDCLSLTSVHVNRMLRLLDGEGLIERNKRSVRIVNWTGLAHRGDFDGSYLHMPARYSALWT